MWVTSDVSAIESLFLQYNSGPKLCDASWRDFFKGFEFARTAYDTEGGAIPENVTKEFKVIVLIQGYRQRGHLFTKTNPVRERRSYAPTLALETLVFLIKI
jgi:2-oxoglutarate dehydrogenase E1 component